jgi:hypothetical protein
MPRSCDTCAVCCVYFPYQNVKPCPNLQQPLSTNNCLVHESKPATCQAFQCGWLQGLGEEGDRPDLSGVMVLLEGPGVNKDYAVKIDEGADEAVIQRMATDLGKPLIIADSEAGKTGRTSDDI